MKISYTIQVCNESRELFSLLNFLLKVKDAEDDIIVVVDSLHKTAKVQRVLDFFSGKVTVYERPFDNFLDNSNFHIEKATGDYIFGVDADEMPQEALIKVLKNVLRESGADALWIPRINIHPGSTESFIKETRFHVNDKGWINWPDYQGRVYKRNGKIRWGVETVHSKLIGAEKSACLGEVPQLALWHIKSIEKQESRWSNGDIRGPSTENLYDDLM
jgi:glycosyltransferase involved in cell wall biosynthesis